MACPAQGMTSCTELICKILPRARECPRSPCLRNCRTAAWAQLAFEGITASQIAKRTGTKTDAVKKGLAVAESATVTSVLHEHELTLDQAAVLLEFEDDADARAHLIEVATNDPTQFEHTAQSLREDAAEKARLAAVEQEPSFITNERARNAAVRDFTMKWFADRGMKPADSQANFMFVNIGRPVRQFREACVAKGVRVARDFPPFEKTHCRIAFGTMEEMQAAVQVFAEVLGKAAAAA